MSRGHTHGRKPSADKWLNTPADPPALQHALSADAIPRPLHKIAQVVSHEMLMNGFGHADIEGMLIELPIVVWDRLCGPDMRQWTILGVRFRRGFK